MKKEFKTGKKSFYLFVGMLSIMLLLVFLGPIVSAVDYRIGYYTLARSVTKTGEPIGQPVFEVDSGLGGVFLTIDEFVYSYVKFEQITGPYALKVEWYSPDGKLYYSGEFKEESGKSLTDWWMWTRIGVAGKLGEEHIGVWKIVTYFNDKPIIIAKFLLLTPELVWFFTREYGRISEENEALREMFIEYEQRVKSLELDKAKLEDNLSEVNSKFTETFQELSRVSFERDNLKAEVSSLQIKSQQLENQVNDLSYQRLILIAIAVLTSISATIILVIKRKQITPPPPP
ncbi:MAG: hypothetical protein QXE67_00310 [Nitrososphaerota archaeon]|nr:hypothetical protein [Candidatus Geocrenenecus dongiae]